MHTIMHLCMRHVAGALRYPAQGDNVTDVIELNEVSEVSEVNKATEVTELTEVTSEVTEVTEVTEGEQDEGGMERVTVCCPQPFSLSLIHI